MSETAMTTRIRCGRGGHYHDSTADVRLCYNGKDVPTYATRSDTVRLATTTAPEELEATSNQIRFAKSLLNQERYIYQPGLGSLGRRSVSEVITRLRSGQPDGRFAAVEEPAYCEAPECLRRPEWQTKLDGRTGFWCDGCKRTILAQNSRYRATVTPIGQDTVNRAEGTVAIPGLPGVRVPAGKSSAFDPETLEDGFYALPIPTSPGDFHVFKVIVAVHKTGRKYAKLLNTETGEWDMAPGRVRDLRPEMRMTLDQALAVARVVANDVNGALYGRCFKCGRTLTAEDSIERFMGPVCAGSFK